MLDITTSGQQAPTSATGLNYCGYGLADDLDLAAELLDDEMMDPLFDEDWLHENNLDILFDLFEEEIESKVSVEGASGASATAAATTTTHLFGTSPVTSYLFGTPPSLASTLDLLYLDNNNQAQQQQQQQHLPQHLTTATTTVASVAGGANIGAKTLAASISSTSATISNTSTTISNKSTTISNKSTTSTFNFSGAKAHTSAGHHHHHRVGGGQRVSASSPKVGSNVNSGANGLASTTTNAIRIKRGLKRGGQSEGISLLAKPISARKAYGGSAGRAVLREHSYAARAH